MNAIIATAAAEMCDDLRAKEADVSDMYGAIEDLIYEMDEDEALSSNLEAAKNALECVQLELADAMLALQSAVEGSHE